MSTITYFEIKHANGTIALNGINSFSTQEDALIVASAFKRNPRNNTTHMTNENVEYWKNQTFVIVKKTIQTEELQSI